MGTFPSKSMKVRHAVKGVLGTTVAVPLLFSALPAAAQDQDAIEQLREQIQQLQTQVDSLQADQEESSSSGGGLMLGKTKIDIGGYIKVDGIYDFDGDDGASLGPSDVNLDGSGDGHTGATAKQSRLTISTTTPTEIGDVGGYFEFDMYGDSFELDNEYSPHVRQAYITYGNWLIGKAWSTFSDFNYGTMLNFYGPQAQLFERQEQVRYTFDLGDDSSFDVALETPDGATVANDAANPTATDETQEKFPDLAMRFSSSVGNLSFQMAAIGRYIKADTINGDDDSTFGYGLDLGGSYALPTGTTLMLSANYGEGNGKYVYDPAGGPDVYVDSDGDLETIERYGYIATISQELAPKWTANLVWGQAFSEDYYDSPDVHDKSSTAAINLLYTPVDPLTLGIEYDRADYENQGGDDGDANWIQVSAIYNF